MKKLFLFFTILFWGYLTQAQTYTIQGTVRDAATLTPLHRASIAVEATTYGTISNKKGDFRLKIKNKNSFTLHVSFIGYENNTLTFPEDKLAQLQHDTLHIDVLLTKKTIEIAPIEIVASSAPDTIYGSHDYHISDFEFFGEDEFLFLVYEKKVNKYARLLHADKNKKILTELTLTSGATELFKDVEGNINVIAKNEVYRVILEDGKILLGTIPKDEFDQLIRPCVDTINHQIIFSDYQWYYPEFNYYSYNKTDSTRKKIIRIVDEHMHELFRSEYKYLSPRDKLEARKIEWKTGMDKEDAAALFISNFQHNFYYESLYAPAFVINDTIMVFDHYHDHIYQFDQEAQLLDSIPIQYHKIKEQKWKQRIIKDGETDDVYSLSYKNGNYYLNKINTKNGATPYSFKISYRYAENFKIKDEYVYYIYRPFESLQKKYLYKEKIN